MADKIFVLRKGGCRYQLLLLFHIQGDGIGVDIWKNAQLVFDKAFRKAYGWPEKGCLKEILSWEKAADQTGDWLLDETLATIKDCLVAVIQVETLNRRRTLFLNVALRQELILACSGQFVLQVEPQSAQAPREDRISRFFEIQKTSMQGLCGRVERLRTKVIDFCRRICRLTRFVSRKLWAGWDQAYFKQGRSG